MSIVSSAAGIGIGICTDADAAIGSRNRARVRTTGMGCMFGIIIRTIIHTICCIIICNPTVVRRIDLVTVGLSSSEVFGAFPCQSMQTPLMRVHRGCRFRHRRQQSEKTLAARIITIGVSGVVTVDTAVITVLVGPRGELSVLRPVQHKDVIKLMQCPVLLDQVRQRGPWFRYAIRTEEDTYLHAGSHEPRRLSCQSVPAIGIGIIIIGGGVGVGVGVRVRVGVRGGGGGGGGV